MFLPYGLKKKTVRKLTRNIVNVVPQQISRTLRHDLTCHIEDTNICVSPIRTYIQLSPEFKGNSCGVVHIESIIKINVSSEPMNLLKLKNNVDYYYCKNNYTNLCTLIIARVSEFIFCDIDHTCKFLGDIR